jgi:hypothetical protein
MTPSQSPEVGAEIRERCEKLWESCCSYYGADHEQWCVTQFESFAAEAFALGRKAGLLEAASMFEIAPGKPVNPEAGKTAAAIKALADAGRGE